jgi:hypothetical protein
MGTSLLSRREVHNNRNPGESSLHAKVRQNTLSLVERQFFKVPETRIRKGTIMKRTTALALLGLACLAAMPSIAHARYRDGMNLYQYVRSSPTSYVDWNGAAAKKPDTTTGKPGDTDKLKEDTDNRPVDKEMGEEGATTDVFEEAHFFHTVGTYKPGEWWGKISGAVGHTGIGCKLKGREEMIVFDHDGPTWYNTHLTLRDWMEGQAKQCEKPCEFTLEDLHLNLTEKQVNRLCLRLYLKSDQKKAGDVDLGWDWFGRGGSHGHNCNSAVVEDMGATTPIDVPERPAAIEAIVNPAAYYNRWGKYTAPWLRRHGWVKNEKQSEHACTGGGAGAGR